MAQISRTEYCNWTFYDRAGASCIDVSYPDVYFSASYASSAEILENAEWEMAVRHFPRDNVSIYHAYLKRDIKHLRESSPSAIFDITSPYGYCGPWSSGIAHADHWRVFQNEFLEISRSKGYVAQFIRFSPLIDDQQQLFRKVAAGSVSSWLHQQSVAIDLTAGVEGYLQRSKKKHRRAVKKAQSLGYIASVENFDAVARSEL